MKSFEVIDEFPELDTTDTSSFGFMEDSSSSGSGFIDTAFGVMPVLIGIFVVLCLAVMAFIIYSQVRNYRKIKSAGMDPLTLEADLATRLAQSNLLAPQEVPGSKVERTCRSSHPRSHLRGRVRAGPPRRTQGINGTVLQIIPETD